MGYVILFLALLAVKLAIFAGVIWVIAHFVIKYW